MKVGFERCEFPRVEMMEFYIARHGETDSNMKGILAGSSDVSINELGVLQARQLSKEVKKNKIEKIYSSCTLRASQTSEILQGDSDIKVIYSELLNARSHGKLEGTKYSDLNSHQCLLVDDSINENEFVSSEFLNESFSEVLNRVNLFFELHKNELSPKTLIVTHNSIIKAILFLYFSDVFKSDLRIPKTKLIHISIGGKKNEFCI